MNGSELSEKWRKSDQFFLPDKRWVIGLSIVNIACMSVISLYQTGVIKKIPEPNLPGIDSAKINGSGQAYEILDMPDGVLGLCSYAVTLGLATVGGANRYKNRPSLPLMLFSKALLDSAIAAKLLLEERSRYRSICFYCCVSVAATTCTLIKSFPEALAALKACD